MAHGSGIARTERFHGRAFSRARLRDGIAPDAAAYSFLESGLGTFRDLYKYFDDFDRTLVAGEWSVTNSGSAGAANFAAAANSLLTADAGTTDDGDARLISNNTVKPWMGGKRATAIFRIYLPAAVTSTKFEVGFIDAVGAGAVNVKATPTSTRTDYTVAIRDTDDDTNISLIGDGTTDAVSSVDGSVTIATTTFYDVMIALNENKEGRLWVNSQFQGKISTGPDITTGLSLWAYIQDRDDVDNKQLSLDYVAAWQERTAIASQ